MKVVAVEGAQLTLPEVADLARSEPVILTRRGKPVAAVRTLAGSDWESVALANHPEFLALIEESRRSYREQGGIPLAEIRAELGVPSKLRGRHKKGAASRPSRARNR